jgi:hypothetical protein
VETLFAGNGVLVQLVHAANIACHVLFGTAALLVGFRQILTSPVEVHHAKRGRQFVAAVTVVLFTATIGLTLFEFRAFLAVITALAAYWTYSGLRTLRIRYSGPQLQDAVASLTGLAAVSGFIWFLPQVSLPWNPAVIYSTLATLAVICTYDLLRFAFPARWFRQLWIYEHVVKMISAHSAVFAAFAGTVLAAAQPFSQLAPSVFSIAAIAIYLSMLGRGRLKLNGDGSGLLPTSGA